MTARTLLVLILLLTAGCSMPVNKGAGDALITGTVTYRERIAVSPEAEVRVVLLDVSKMDVMATLIAETRFRASGGPPYAFALSYDPGQIQPGMRYSLRATIHLGERLLFTSTSSIDPFATGEIEILVSKVDRTGRE